MTRKSGTEATNIVCFLANPVESNTTEGRLSR